MGCRSCKFLLPKSNLTPIKDQAINDNIQTKAQFQNHKIKRKTVNTNTLNRNETFAQAKITLTSLISTDTSVAAKAPGNPTQAVGIESSPEPTTIAVKPADKDLRNLSTCRLKKSAQLCNFYCISNEVLGTGISGTVLVADHIGTKRRYAIKTLSLEGVNPKKATMLHNEVSVYLQLDHPNIAKLIEVYETDEAIHLVMELCTGGELFHRLATRKQYSERDAANVTQQMLSAINYCHKHHICHRDLKLENWVYADPAPDAPIKLIDFGFSRIFNPGIPMTAMHGTVYYVSPEVMDGCYEEKCDIWSIGVIVYMLLSGSPPFNGNHDHEILVRIKRGVVNFDGSRWTGISGEAKSFIRYLLQKNPDLRPSAKEALNHPWLKNRDSSEKREIDIAVLQSMKDFALCNILKRAAFNVVALSLTSQEVEELETAFRKFDYNNQGTIPLQTLVNLLVEYLHIESSEAKTIFDKINQTGSSEVHYTEFIASTLQARFIKNESLVEEAFKKFDLNHQNKITLDNLRNVLGDSYNGTYIEDIIAICDTNRDGYIDFDEFRKALTSDDVAVSKTSSEADSQEAISTPSLPQTKRKSALSTLHSIRKATYLETDADKSMTTESNFFKKRTAPHIFT